MHILLVKLSPLQRLVQKFYQSFIDQSFQITILQLSMVEILLQVSPKKFLPALLKLFIDYLPNVVSDDV
jgi:hypothetical protein